MIYKREKQCDVMLYDIKKCVEIVKMKSSDIIRQRQLCTGIVRPFAQSLPASEYNV